MTKPASAFAPAEVRGKTIAWENVLDEPEPALVSTKIPTLVRTVGAIETRIATLIPVSVTRGVVTMERVRGNLAVYFNSTELAAAFANWFVHLMIQLVPIQDGAIVTDSVLSAGNSADQESNRIIWQRLYYPNVGTTITGPAAVEYHTSQYSGQEVDIKVKRKWDRATWALVLSYDGEAAAVDLHILGGQLRALFRSSDGI